MDSGAKNQYTCHVKAKAKPFTFRCEIDQFPFRMVKIGDQFDCPKFEVGDGVLMFVRLERVKEVNDVEVLSVRLYKHSEDKDIKLDHSIVLVNNQPNKSVKRVSPPRLFESEKKHWGWPCFILYASLVDKNAGFLADGHALTLIVEGVAFIEDEKQNDNDILSDQALRNEIGDDLEKMFDEGMLSDFLVKVKDADGGPEVEFKVHRMVLAARSKFFAAMFSQPEAKECREGVMKVEYVDSGAMESLLRFLYTGKAPPQSEASEGDEGNNDLLELLIAADKYGILGLKAVVERRLSSTLSNKNVCEVLMHADRLKASHLKARCIEFIRLHRGPVTRSAGWRQLIAPENADLVGTLFREDGTMGAEYEDDEVDTEGDQMGASEGNGEEGEDSPPGNIKRRRQ